jgi:hypothetical protein
LHAQPQARVTRSGVRDSTILHVEKISVLRIFLNMKNQNTIISNQMHCCKPRLCAACVGMAAPPVKAWADEGLHITDAGKMAMSAKVRNDAPVAEQQHVKNLLEQHLKNQSLFDKDKNAFLSALTACKESDDDEDEEECNLTLELTLACFEDNEVLQSIENGRHKKMFTRALTNLIGSFIEYGVPSLVGTTCTGRWHAGPYLVLVCATPSVRMYLCVTRYVLRTQGRRRTGLTFCTTRSLEQPWRPRTYTNGCICETQRTTKRRLRWRRTHRTIRNLFLKVV